MAARPRSLVHGSRNLHFDGKGKKAMLRLWKRDDSPNWYARGVFLGQRVDESLGTADRGQAERLLEKIQADILEQKSSRAVRPAQTFAAAVNNYIDRGGEMRFLEPLARHFRETPIDQIDQAAIDHAALTILPRASFATRNRQVYTPMSAILRTASVQITIRRPKMPEGIIRSLTHDEAPRLLDASAPHLRPLVMFLLLTGARAGEALWLDWRHVDLARAHVSFPKTKNGKARGIALHRDLVAELANLPHRDGEVFRRPDGKPYERPKSLDDTSAGTRIKNAFNAACRRADIENFRVHDCRHTWASWHYAQHKDLVMLKRQGGWKTLAMVLRYAHQNSDRDREAIDALPSLAKSEKSVNSANERLEKPCRSVG
jgi:integrase